MNYDTGNSVAHTVIVHHVDYQKAVHGSPKTPFARTIGEGRAEIYRDGKRFNGTWVREASNQKTKYTVDGEPIPLKGGQTWILLSH